MEKVLSSLLDSWFYLRLRAKQTVFTKEPQCRYYSITSTWYLQTHSTATRALQKRSLLLPHFLRNVGHRFYKRLPPYLEAVNYLLKKFTADQTIAEFNPNTLQIMQPAIMRPQRYADSLVPNLCKVTDVYDEGTLNDLISKRVDSGIRQRFSHNLGSEAPSRLDTHCNASVMAAFHPKTYWDSVANEPKHLSPWKVLQQNILYYPLFGQQCELGYNDYCQA